MPPGSDRTRIVSQEAAYWHIRCTDERNMARSDRRLFVKWIKRSPENISELLRITRVDGRVAQQKLIDRFSDIDGGNIVDIDFGGSPSQYEYEPSDTVEETPSPQKTGTRPFLAIVATIAAFAVALVLSFVVLKRSPEGTVETHASQWQHMTLEDGSTVHIDARSRLQVEFSGESRLVHLFEGQAVFDVEKDPRRPFVVQTELADVIAVGTRFGVAINPGVTTTVQEGVVKVVPHGQEGAEPVMVGADQQYRVENKPPQQAERAQVGLERGQIKKVDAKRKLLWTTGWIDTEGVTVREMVDEFNRRHATQAQIDNPEIAGHRMRFIRLKIDSVERFSEVMDNEEGVTATMDTDNKTLHLRSE